MVAGAAGRAHGVADPHVLARDQLVLVVDRGARLTVTPDTSHRSLSGAPGVSFPVRPTLDRDVLEGPASTSLARRENLGNSPPAQRGRRERMPNSCRDLGQSAPCRPLHHRTRRRSR
jgi:hypothetical protein